MPVHCLAHTSITHDIQYSILDVVYLHCQLKYVTIPLNSTKKAEIPADTSPTNVIAQVRFKYCQLLFKESESDSIQTYTSANLFQTNNTNNNDNNNNYNNVGNENYNNNVFSFLVRVTQVVCTELP